MATSDQVPTLGSAPVNTLAADVVRIAETGWRSDGLTATDIAALRRVAKTTVDCLVSGDYPKYRALRVSQGATLNEAARHFVKREAAAKQYKDLDVAAVMSKPLDDQIAFFWTNAKARTADWRSVDLESAAGGTGNKQPKPNPDEFLLGQGSLFSMADVATLSQAFNAGAAKVAWLEVPVSLGTAKSPIRVRLLFCNDESKGVWFPVWIFATPKDGTFPKLMI